MHWARYTRKVFGILLYDDLTERIFKETFSVTFTLEINDRTDIVTNSAHLVVFQDTDQKELKPISINLNSNQLKGLADTLHEAANFLEKRNKQVQS